MYWQRIGGDGPTVIPAEHYEHTGWNGRFGSATGLLEITAQYALVKHAVTFVPGTHGVFDPAGAAAAQQVDHSSGATAPTVIPVAGYESAGWDCEFSSVTGPLTVTALYDKCMYTVRFVSNGGSAVSDITAEFDMLTTVPVAPMRDYHTFAGWFKGTGLTQKWDFAALEMSVRC